jgi:hypothetical protein
VRRLRDTTISILFGATVSHLFAATISHAFQTRTGCPEQYKRRTADPVAGRNYFKVANKTLKYMTKKQQKSSLSTNILLDLSF